MLTAHDDFEHRLMPMSAGDYYLLRHRLATIADQMRAAANGGPLSSIEIEEWWLELTVCMTALETAWEDRRPNLRVVK